MGLRFGTDGVRGPADQFTDAFVLAIGEAAARVLGPRFIIGRDTRESGTRIERALVAGLARGGASSLRLGVAPTPAVAWLAADTGVCGAVISASHNVWSDNGIKFFGAGGRKLSGAVEAELEELIDVLLADVLLADEQRARSADADADAESRPAPVEDPSGPSPEASAGLERWIDSLRSSVSGSFDRCRVVIDCANGAQSAIAAEVLRSLGAEVEVLDDAPDGRNINAGCGSTHPQRLQQRVVESGADLGLAFDGDADRLLAVDERGEIVDGDHLIALFAVDRRARGLLHGDLVVVTVMTNLGFRLAMAEHGIGVIETAVGDRHVLEALAETGGSLGGEQSGHIVFADLASTGDGLLSGLQLLDLVCRSHQPLSQLASEVMTALPQVLRNVPVAVRRSDIAEVMAADVEREQALLGTTGRILLRPSGTEPLIRVMVEASTDALAAEVADRLAAAVIEVCSA